MSNQPTDKNIAFVRSQLDEIVQECEWLWNEDLTQLEDLPQIEGRDLAGHNVPSLKEGLTDREKACYLLGRVNGYAHAGSAIEESLERDYSDIDTTTDVDGYDEPIGAFWMPEDEPNGEFYSHDGW